MKRTVESISLSITFLVFALILARLYFKEIETAGEITPQALYLIVHGAISAILFVVFSLSILIHPIAVKYEEWFSRPHTSQTKKCVGFLIFLTLWIAIFINFLEGLNINQLPEFLRPTAVYIAIGWPSYVGFALVINLVEDKWRIFQRIWQSLRGKKPLRSFELPVKALLLDKIVHVAKFLKDLWSRIVRPLLNRLILGIIGIILLIGGIGFGIVWTYNHYRSGEFFYEFTGNILAALIGVIIGALSAIIITLFFINPYVRRKEEEKLQPLRRPILMFWDHTLTLYTTSIFTVLDFPTEIARVVSDVSSQVILGMDSLADEQKLIELERLLLESDIREEVVVRSLEVHRETLQEYKDFLLRMHDTVVALPYLFKDTPEVASRVEMLVGNFLSGLKMMEYKTHVENNIETTILEFYGTSIIKMTAREAFALVREIRQARLRHQ